MDDRNKGGGGGGGESFVVQSINTEETDFGRSYLLGNRKGLGGLKNKKREINQVYILKSKQQPIKNRFEETFEREWTSFLHDPLFSVGPAVCTPRGPGPLRAVKLTWLSKPLSSEFIIILSALIYFYFF